MKKLTLFLSLFLFITSLQAQTGWMWQNPLPQGNELRASSLNFVVGAGGTVIQKNFYGWDMIDIGTKENLNDIYIEYSSERGWIVGENGSIFYTYDGGENWTQQYSGTTETLHSIVSAGYTTWACGDNATLLKTQDNGQTWEKISTIINSLCFYDMSLYNVKTSSHELWIAGEDGLIISTGDGGQTWTSHYGGTSWDFFDIDMTEYATSRICGNSGIIISKDWDEENWQKENESLNYKLNSIISFVGQSGYAVGSNGTILRGTDGGNTWLKKETGISWELNDISSHSRSDPSGSDRSVYGQYGIMLEDDGYDSEFEITNDLFWHFIQSIEFVNQDTGWAAGGDPGWGGTTDGIILHTTNGGETWKVQQDLQTPLNAMDFVNENKGWAVGRDGLIKFTNNGGANWSTQTSPLTKTLTSVCFTDENNGWIVSMSNWGEIIHTTNGGATWSTQTNPSGNPLHDVFFIDENNGWAVGLDSSVIKTTNGGAHWQWINVNASLGYRFASVFFVDEMHGWIAGIYGSILRTTNGGTSWQEVESGTNETLNDIYFIDAEIGWAVGDAGTILHSIDGGITWSKQVSGITTNFLTSICFVDGQRGWVAGEGGSILYTIHGGSGLTNTIHVDDDNVSGIEDGSLENPFTSVAEAIDVAIAGDSVVIHPGTYDESPLLHMDIKDGLIIVGEDSASTFIPIPFYMGELSMKYPTEITGLTCPGYSFANNDGKGIITIKRCHFNDMDISSVNGHTFIVEDCIIEGSINNADGTNMITIRNNHFLNGGINVLGRTTEEMGAVIIEGNRIDRHELPPTQNSKKHSPLLPAGKNTSIESANTAIEANYNFITITNNIINIQDEGSGIIVSGGSIADITGNVINLPVVTAPGQSMGIKTVADSSIVKGNEIHGGYYGLYSNSMAGLLDGNSIDKAHTGFYGKGAVTVQNNLIKNCSGNGLIANGLKGPVQDNTIIENDSAGIIVLQPVDLGGGDKNSKGRNILQNNGYFDLYVKYQPNEQDTLYALYNLWDHESLDEIFANDLLSDGGENLVIELGGFIIFPNIPGLIFPVNNATSDTLNIELSWWQTSVPDRYHLQLATDNNFATMVIDTTNLNDTTLLITLEQETVYYWRVQAVNPAGESDWSETWQFTTDVAGLLENEKDPIIVEIFPNPASGTLTIRSEILSQKSVIINIVDLNGKKLKERKIPKGTNDIIMDISELKNGIYFCHIRSQDHSLVRKIIIQK